MKPVLSLLALVLAAAEETLTDEPGRVSVTFASKSLALASSSDGGSGELAILLPPSYLSSPNRRYPVVYAFHGYGDNVDQLILAASPHLEGYKGPEFIHGAVAKMVTKEVVPLIDSQYRTIPAPKGRLLAGFSMGGYAAWTLGLARHDLFSGIWASCPGALEAGFGRAAPYRLRAVRFEYAVDDYLGWITRAPRRWLHSSRPPESLQRWPAGPATTKSPMTWSPRDCFPSSNKGL